MVAKRHRFGFFHPELLIAALLIILVGAVLYFTTTRTNLPQLVSLSTPVPEAKGEDNMSDWKTYTDVDYGFKFAYPPNWYFETGPAVSEKKVFGPQISFFVEGTKPDFSRYNHEGNDLLTLYTSTDIEYFEKIPSHYPESLPTIIGGKEAIRANQKLVVIKLSELELLNVEWRQSSIYANRFDQIISAFEFTDSNDSAYTCPASGGVSCKPPGSYSDPMCSSVYLSWAQENCLNFSVAY